MEESLLGNLKENEWRVDDVEEFHPTLPNTLSGIKLAKYIDGKRTGETLAIRPDSKLSQLEVKKITYKVVGVK